MNCKWPESCDLDCSRCAVIRACLHQVPQDGMVWALRHGYGAYGVGPNDTASRSIVAQWVVDRLIAWVRWPGCSHPPEAEIGYPVECMRCGTKNVLSPPVHPLDATPAGGLRPGGNFGGPVVPDEWFESWLSLAVIVDAMTMGSLWPALHAWRPEQEHRRRSFWRSGEPEWKANDRSEYLRRRVAYGP